MKKLYCLFGFHKYKIISKYWDSYDLEYFGDKKCVRCKKIKLYSE